MSTVVSKNLQVGTSGTPAQNFTLYQPATPDGTVRLANGNSGSTTDLLTVNAAGAITQSAATANGVMFANGSKVLTTGSALTFDGTNLLNSGALRLTGGASSNVRFESGGSEYARIMGNGSNSLDFAIGGTTPNMSLTSTGLGIGTSSPNAKLRIQNDNSTVPSLIIRDGGTPAANMIEVSSNATGNALILNASGNLGIGTTSPSTKLHVANAGATFVRTHNTSSTVDLYVGSQSNDATVAVVSNHPLTFATNSIERARIDSSGNFMVGQTSATGKMSVTGTGSGNVGVFAINATDTSSTFVWAQQAFLAGQTAGQNFINFIGKSASTRNAAYVGYKFSSDGSANNLLTFGHFGADNLMNLDGNGNLLVGTTNNGASTTGGIRMGDIAAINQDINSLYINAGAVGASTATYLKTGNAAVQIFMDSAQGTIKFGRAQSGTAGSAFGFAESARISAGGDILLTLGGSFYGLDQYVNKKMMKFEYPTTGFGAFSDALDFATPGGGSSLNQMRVTQQGNVGCRGSFSGGQTLNDYAEYFEWADGNPANEDRIGVTVVLDGDKIRPSTEQDSGADIFGVVSGTAGVVLGSSPFEWAGKYQKDEFGRIVTEKVTWVYWHDGLEHHNYKVDEVPEGVVVPASAEYRTYDNQAIVAGYNESAEYQSRDQRKEWAAIGLVGQVHVKAGQLVGDRWRKMKDVSSNVAVWLIR